MARPLQIEYPGAYYPVNARGNEAEAEVEASKGKFEAVKNMYLTPFPMEKNPWQNMTSPLRF